MKSLYLLGCFLLIALLLIACNQDDKAPTPDVDATVQSAVEATVQAVEATAQAAKQAAIQAAVNEAQLAAQPASTPEPVVAVSNDGRERHYRSYPAPTGLPGFRLYYQKRCYPGCHTDGIEQVHP
jgi:hypothetical protein